VETEDMPKSFSLHWLSISYNIVSHLLDWVIAHACFLF
jgi:hypothetical protein